MMPKSDSSNHQSFTRSSIPGGEHPEKYSMEWEGKNINYLAKLEQQSRMERRRSSAMVSSYMKLLDLLGEDDDAAEDEYDDASIDARLHQIANHLGNKRQEINRDGGDLAISMHTSLTLNEIFDDDTSEKGKGASFGTSFNKSSLRNSSRMSLCSRKSARMSLILRQSHLDSFVIEKDAKSGPDEAKKTRHIPDVFGTSRNKRESVITPSTLKLVSTVFGNEAAKIASESRGSENALLLGALEPVTADELMSEIGGMEGSEDSFAYFVESMSASQSQIDKLVDINVKKEQQRIMNQLRLESIGKYAEDKNGNEDTLRDSFFNSSRDFNMNPSIKRIMRDL